MSTAEKAFAVAPEEYLAGEEVSEFKHELIDGQVYAMTGVKANHQRITINLSVSFGHHLADSKCEPFGPDMRLRVDDNFFCPDMMVVCDFDESEQRYAQNPVLIIEVLSDSTARHDRTTKRHAYTSIPSLQEYVLIEQDFVDIEVMSKSQDWASRHYFLGDEIHFESIDLTLKVEDIYRRVQNEDTAKWAIEQK